MPSSSSLQLAYISQLTGISFAEAATGTSADIHFANDIVYDARAAGLCSWGRGLQLQPTTRYIIDQYNQRLRLSRQHRVSNGKMEWNGRMDLI